MSLPVGKQLQDARLARGLTFEDVQFETRIHHAVLAAMENDDLGAFPNQTYARKFYAAYATHLGIDAGAFLSRFHPASLSGVVEYHPYLQPSTDRVSPSHKPPPRRPPSSPPTALIVAIGVLTLAAAIGIWAGLHSHRKRTSVPSAAMESPPPLTPNPPTLPIMRATPGSDENAENPQ